MATSGAAFSALAGGAGRALGFLIVTYLM